MIPVLYGAYESNFQTMGICPLSDCASARVKRVLNGKDELEIKYPVDGVYFGELQNTRQVLVQPEYQKQPQVYRIYKISKPIKGTVTVYARHVSERKAFDIVKPFTCNTIQEALVQINRNIYLTDSPWSFHSNIYDSNERFVLSVPASLGSVLSMLSKTYGGDFEFDMYNVHIWKHRGTGEQPGDNTVEILYGKNLIDLEAVEAVDEKVITGICPIWTSQDGQLVHLTNYIINSQYAGLYPFDRVAVVNFTSAFENRPSEQQLERAAIRYMESQNIGLPAVSLKVSFVNLAQTQEYEYLGILERVNLGDTVFIRHIDLGVNMSARVTQTDFDVLNEKYVSVTVGQVVQNMSSTLSSAGQNVDDKILGASHSLSSAVSHTIETMTGADGGYIFTNYDSDGYPVEKFIMDTDDKSTAVNVIRLNKDGIGFSSNGINGPYRIGWRINDYIDIVKGKIDITASQNGERVIRVKYGTTEVEVSNKSVTLTQKDTSNNIVKQVFADVQDMSLILQDASSGWLKLTSAGVELHDDTDRKEAEITNAGVSFYPDSTDPTKIVSYPATGWSNAVSESAESIGASWTKSLKIYVIPNGADGWYTIEAAADGCDGVAIGIIPVGSSDVRIIGFNEITMPDIAGDTISGVTQSCMCFCSGGDTVVVYAKTVTAGQKLTSLRVHGRLP